MSDEAEGTYPIIVKLSVPVPIEGTSERIEQLSFRRGILKDIKGIKLGDDIPADSLMRIASRMCGQSIDVLEKLDADDAGRVMKIAISFFKKCLGTGSVRSPS